MKSKSSNNKVTSHSVLLPTSCIESSLMKHIKKIISHKFLWYVCNYFFPPLNSEKPPSQKPTFHHAVPLYKASICSLYRDTTRSLWIFIVGVIRPPSICNGVGHNNSDQWYSLNGTSNAQRINSWCWWEILPWKDHQAPGLVQLETNSWRSCIKSKITCLCESIS